MKTRFLLVFLLTAILVAMTVSAVDFTVSTPETFVQGKASVTFKVTNTNATNPVTVVFSPLKITGEKAHEVTFAVTGNTTIAAASFETFTITPTNALDYSNFNLGKTYTTTLTVSEQGNLTNKKDVTLSLKKSYCENSVQGSDLLELDVDIKNDIGYGEEDNEWYPLDQIEVTANVDNTANDDIDNIVVEWCLYNPEKGKCTDIEDEEDDFKLKEDKDKDVILSFQVEPDDIDESTDDYVFVLKAYSKDKDYGEDKLCVEYSEDISVMRDSHFVILDNLVISDTVPCSGTLDISADVWNIGDDDEEGIYVTVYNKELGLNERVDIGDIDVFESEKLSFNFNVPATATEKRYFVELSIYDEDNDLFESDNDDKAIFTTSFLVEGDCVKEAEKVKSALITAELDSDAVPGEQLAIRGTIKNTGEEDTTYSLRVSGYNSWATLDNLDLKSATLKAGESKDFNIYFNVNDNVQGEQFFKIATDFDGKTTEQEVSVLFEEQAGAGITGSVILDNLRENWFIWVIVVINIILIIAIIAVARRIATAR